MKRHKCSSDSHVHMGDPIPSVRHPKRPRAPTHLSLGKDLVLIIGLIKLHRLSQLHLREVLRVLGPHRTRPYNANVPIDLLLMAYQPRDLVGRQARIGLESACIPVDVVVPLIGAQVVVELADFGGSSPSKVLFELALFCRFVAEIGKIEGLDLAGDGVKDGRVWSLRCGAEDIAIGFWGCVGLAGCFTGRFVRTPVASLTAVATVFGSLACTALVSACFRTGGIGTDVGHAGSYTSLRLKGW